MPSTPAVEDVKKYVPQLNTSHNEVLELIEARARSIIDAHYRLKLGPGWPGFAAYATAERVVYGWSTHELALPPHRVGSVTAVKDTVLVDGEWVAAGDVYPADWYESPDSGNVLWPAYSWGRNAYAVTADWGYGPMPDAAYQVLLELMINIWRQKDRAQDQEGHPVTFSAKLTDAQREQLDSVLAPWQSKYGTIKVYRAPF